MKKLMTSFVLTCAITVNLLAQDDKASTIWAVHHFTPKNVTHSELTKRIFEHDKKFHEDKSALLSVITGNNAGDMLWAYGPMTYTDMDNMKLPDGHEADNMSLNEQLIEDYHSMTVWKLQPEFSVELEGVENYSKRTHTHHKLKRGSWSTWKEIASKHIEVYKKHKLSEVNVFTAVYGTEDGRNLLLIAPFENFASFDNDWGYKEKFEAVHGEGSLKEATDMMNSIIEESYSFMTVINSREE